MKKFIGTMLILLVASVVSAVYPDAYYGDPLPMENGECVEIQAHLESWLDMNPWGMPDPTGTYFLFGSLCLNEGVAVLTFNTIAGRECKPRPYGTIEDLPICEYWAPRTITGWGEHILAWSPKDTTGVGVYIATIEGQYPFWKYESFTYTGGESGTFVEGVFEFVTPLWFFESDLFTRKTYVIAPKTATPRVIIRGMVRK